MDYLSCLERCAPLSTNNPNKTPNYLWNQGLWHEAADLFTIAANARQWVTYKHIGSWDYGHIKAYQFCIDMANHCTYMASVL